MVTFGLTLLVNIVTLRLSCNSEDIVFVVVIVEIFFYKIKIADIDGELDDKGLIKVNCV